MAYFLNWKNLVKRIIYIISFLTLVSATPPQGPGYDTNAKIKSVFIYNFTKYIEWPKNYRQGNFIVGVLGESSLYKELENMAKTKKVANQDIELVKFNDSKAISNCHILIIPPDRSDELNNAIKQVKKNSTLIITEKEGLTKEGAAINFIVQTNKQKFELSKTNVEKYNLKVNSSLESLAIVVN
ncbi:hypothetical protein FLAV_01908 [Flavobacteriales bacterium]|nr:hypothetical protein FLAV_01908 [Flavobacteriales bacterium]